jgi:hypothetical protein
MRRNNKLIIPPPPPQNRVKQRKKKKCDMLTSKTEWGAKGLDQAKVVEGGITN